MRNFKRRSDYIRVQRSREARLWVTTILMAGATAVAYLDNHPEVKHNLRDKTDDFLNHFRKNPEIIYRPPTKKN